MRIWDIAKLLIESCSSPEEVAELIGTLSDPNAAQQICAFMSAFDSYEPSSSSLKTEPPVVQDAEREGSRSEFDKIVAGKRDESAVVLSIEANVAHLRSLLRTSGLTNKQVEQWLTENFGVQVTVGKDALSKYLTKVLAGADSDLTNRIMIAAERLKSNDDPSGGDHKAERSPRRQVDGYALPARVVGKIDAEKGGRRAGLSSVEASASQLETIFRTMGMTNKQVEEWMTEAFGAQVLVGKHSLHKYLTKVLDGADLGLINRLLAGAQRLSIDTGSPASDIKEYWDQLDRHFAVVE